LDGFIGVFWLKFFDFQIRRFTVIRKNWMVLVVSVVFGFFLFAFSGVAQAQSPWGWTDTIRPVSEGDVAVVNPITCEGENNCFAWNTYWEGNPQRPIWMQLACPTEGRSVQNGEEVSGVPAGLQLVAAFTARRCEPEGTPTPPTVTPTPEVTETVVPTVTVTITPTVTPTPKPWGTEGWEKWIRPMNGGAILVVNECLGEEDCWKWTAWNGQVAQPVWLESICTQEGSRWEDDHIVEGLAPGENFALGFTVRSCDQPTETPTPEVTETPTPEPTATPKPWANSGWQSVIRPMNGSVELSVQNCVGDQADCWTWSTFANSDGEPLLMEARCPADGEYVAEEEQSVLGIPQGIYRVLGFTARPCPEVLLIPNLRR
jgi:hypothetical protein